MQGKSLSGIVLLAALAGCSDNADPAAKVAARNTIAQYQPPSITSRADYGALIERRFQRMDADRDGKLTGSEIPQRMNERVVARYDANGDKSLNSSEWGKLMLERFDRQDANKDGTVTTEERTAFRASRGQRGGDRATREQGGGDRAARLERRAERERARAEE